MAFWKARIKVTLFTIIVGAGVLYAFSSVVIIPYVWHALAASNARQSDALWLFDGARYGSAFIVLAMVAAAALSYSFRRDQRGAAREGQASTGVGRRAGAWSDPLCRCMNPRSASFCSGSSLGNTWPCSCSMTRRCSAA